MDYPISTTIVLILAWLIALVAFFAQLRLFAISATLKQIATQIKQILHDIERDLPTGDDCPHCGGGMVQEWLSVAIVAATSRSPPWLQR